MKGLCLMKTAIVLLVIAVFSANATFSQEQDEAREPRRDTQQKLERSRREAKEPVHVLEPPVIRSGREGRENMQVQGRTDSVVINQGLVTPREGYRRVFEMVEEGIASGTVNDFAAFFDSQVSVNLRGGESGYYSANQTYYVLESYFKLRRFGHFEFTTFGKSESNPYATGSARFTSKGGMENVQVYVSLSWGGERWVISQFKVY